jgi:hypothetical protein
MARKTLIQIRKGTKAQWDSSNPTLAAGELAFLTDSNKIAVGNGSAPWQSLFPWLRIDGGNLDAQ